MTGLTTTVSSEQHRGGTSPSQAPTQRPVAPTMLITERQVRFSTAAALALPLAGTRGFVAVMRKLAKKALTAFDGSERPPAKRHYPKRYGFIENAAMSRAMDRL